MIVPALDVLGCAARLIGRSPCAFRLGLWVSLPEFVVTPITAPGPRGGDDVVDWTSVATRWSFLPQHGVAAVTSCSSNSATSDVPHQPYRRSFDPLSGARKSEQTDALRYDNNCGGLGNGLLSDR